MNSTSHIIKAFKKDSHIGFDFSITAVILKRIMHYTRLFVLHSLFNNYQPEMCPFNWYYHLY